MTHSLIKRGRPKASSTGRRVPAGDVEALVEDRIIAFLGDGGALHDALAGATSLPHQIEALTAEASRLAERWPGLPAAEKRGLLQDLVSRITLEPDCLEIDIRPARLADMLLNADGASAGATAPDTGEPDIILAVAARLKRTGMEKKLLVEQPAGQSPAKVDANLLKLVARAHELRAIFTQGGRPISEMADAAGLSSSYFTRLLRLSFLAPDITRSILGGRQPAELNAHKIMADTRLPLDWQHQRVRLGFA